MKKYQTPHIIILTLAAALFSGCANQNSRKTVTPAGIDVAACKACADSYGVSDDLNALGIDVRYMGKPLTRYLKANNWKTLTF